LSRRTAVLEQGCLASNPAFLYLSVLFAILFHISVASAMNREMTKALLKEFDCLILLFWSTVQCLTEFVNHLLCCMESTPGPSTWQICGETLCLLFAYLPAVSFIAAIDAVVIPGKAGQVAKTAMIVLVWLLMMYYNISVRLLHNDWIWYEAELPIEWLELSPRALYIVCSTQMCVFLSKLCFMRVWYGRWYVTLKTPMVPLLSQEGEYCTRDQQSTQRIASSENRSSNGTPTEDNANTTLVTPDMPQSATDTRRSGIDPAQGTQGVQHATPILPGQLH